MSIERVRAHFKALGIVERIQELTLSSATVELAAEALGCKPGRIAKSLAFQTLKGPIVVVVAGDTKIDNAKFKAYFQEKARMITSDQLEELIGHAMGGVCPFALNEGVKVYLDESLKEYETVFPACGSSNSAVEMTMAELEQYAEPEAWVAVIKKS